MKTILLPLLLVSTAYWMLPVPRLTAQEALYRPRLSNNKDQSFHDFPLGVLSATGRLSDGEREILVMDVGRGGAADQGGMMVGDKIVSIRGKQATAAFSMKTDAALIGPQAELATAIGHACAAEPHELQLTVRRNDKAIPLNIVVPVSADFSPSFPANCPKADKYLAATSAARAYFFQAGGVPGETAKAKPVGTVLVNSCLLWVNNMWSGSRHDSTKVPLLTAGGLGGTLKTGRVLDYSGEDDEQRKLCSLYLSIMNRMGVSMDSFGDANTQLAGL